MEYIVYGNELGPNNGDYVRSKHRTLAPAARAADRCNRRDCCNGGNLRWHIYELVHRGPAKSESEYMEYDNIDGDTYKMISFFDTHSVAVAPGGLAPVSKY